MSYSSYRAITLVKKAGRAWEDYPEAQNASLVSVPAPRDRVFSSVEDRLNLDILMNAMESQALDPDSLRSMNDEEVGDDWLVKTQHHAVLGGMKGIGLLSSRGSVYVCFNGREIRKFPIWHLPEDHEEVKRDPYKDEQELRGEYGYQKFSVRFLYEGGRYAMTLLEDGRRTTYAAVSGYGIGDHWWKDQEGYALQFKDEEGKDLNPPRRIVTEKCLLDSEWKKMLTEWADRILAGWAQVQKS
jgi:hypothetical protein